jgi:hypothetical protein
MTSSDARTVGETPGASGGRRRARRRAPGEAALVPLLRRCRPPFGTAPGVLASSGRVSSRSTSSGQARPSGSGRRTRRSGWSERGCTPGLPRCSTPGDAGSTAPDPSFGAAIRDVGHGRVLEHVAASARSAPSSEGTNTSPRSCVESLRVARTGHAPLGPRSAARIVRQHGPPVSGPRSVIRDVTIRFAPSRDHPFRRCVRGRRLGSSGVLVEGVPGSDAGRSGVGSAGLMGRVARERGSLARIDEAPHRPAARSVPHRLATHPPREPRVSGVGPDVPSFLQHEARIDAFFFSFLALLVQALVEREVRRGMQRA